MHVRAWIVARWFGFLAVGIAMAAGAGLQFRRASSPLAPESDDADLRLAAESPRPWLAPDQVLEPANAYATPPPLVATTGEPDAATAALDPTSPAADRAVDELGQALAGFDARNVRVGTEQDGDRTRYVFTCEIPTSRGAEAFVGEGPNPESAARDALARIRAWAAAPSESMLR